MSETVTTWQDSLPDDLKGNETLKSVPDVSTLAKNYLESQRYIGGSIRIPGADAGTEDWAKFDEKLAGVPGLTRLPGEGEAMDAVWNKLGRPDTADKYTIARGDKIERNAEAEGAFLAEAHKAGLTNAQAQAMIGYFDGLIGRGTEARATEAQQFEAQLKSEWGAAFEQKLQDAARAASYYGGDELMKMLDASGLGNHPALIKAFAKMGDSIKETPSAGSKATGFAMTPQEAREKISEIMNNRDHAYHNGRAAGHTDAVAKMQDLFRFAYPEAM